MGRQKVQKKTDVLSASEMGQYIYCSTAWFLQRCGYEPESRFLEPGKQAHISLGNTMDDIKRTMRSARRVGLLGLAVLFIAIFVFLFGVIL
jgi:hypothetical protein